MFHLLRTVLMLVTVLFPLLFYPATAQAAECRFVLGFATLRDLIGHDIVGPCLENEHYNAIGDSNQRTAGGLLAWRKADNWTAFTDGYRTWVNGPFGVQKRLNVQRFYWEADYINSFPVKVESVCFGNTDKEYTSQLSEHLSLWITEVEKYTSIAGEDRGDEPWKEKGWTEWIERLDAQEQVVHAKTLELMALTPESEPARMYHAPLVAAARHLLTFMHLWNRTLIEGVWGRGEVLESDTILLNRLDRHHKMHRVFLDAVPDISCAKS